MAFIKSKGLNENWDEDKASYHSRAMWLAKITGFVVSQAVCFLVSVKACAV